jgi:ATP-dependent helicase/nuclease subunit A
MNRPLVIPEILRQAQAKASEPRASAWVSANAGSGKTHVLTQRVLRLLLDGTPPSRILGLTFTKAAAANMAAGIFRTLAEWTTLDDEALSTAIMASGAGRPDAGRLQYARRLFARTIESPGGLRMQTLHAFCERLLRLFPFEANVPAHFKVIDERETKALMAEARLHAIAGVPPGSAQARGLEHAAREAGAFRFPALLAEAQAFAETFAAFEDAESYAAALRPALGLSPTDSRATMEAEMLGGDIGRARRRAWAQTLGAGGKSDLELARGLQLTDSETETAAKIEALLDAFFSKKNGVTGVGEPRGRNDRITTKKLDGHPRLETDLQREQARLESLRDKWRAARTAERSEALFAIAHATLDAFAAVKAEHGVLDFADQTARALKLVTRSSAAWVMHKLDYALDHLLIDEAQDTSPEQWAIVAALTAELFSGASARRGVRTVFAVGDEKQSIFSFQGAAPEKFDEMKRFFAQRHREAELGFEAVPLHFSFRSAQTILDAVDQTFRQENVWKGVSASGEPPPRHQAVRGDMKGLVELWPTVRPVVAPERRDWRMPLDILSLDDPAALLAARIADLLKLWLAPDSGERVTGKDGAPRRMRAGDVMILVRQRNAFFDAMIKALKDRGVEAAGADRLKLKDHIAIMDLIAAGRAALTPDDDLTLACVLKSPLIGLDEDGLFALAARRHGSLSQAVRESADPAARAAAQRLALWRERAQRLAPFDFYARLLGQDGGRRALLGRLGPDAADPIDEFLALALAHERRGAASLVRFVAEVEADDESVKRDMENEAGGVRVLTVHASKGLEAPIVFLPDTCGAPTGQHDPQLFALAPARPGGAPLFAWSRKTADDCTTLADARLQKREADSGEHRRLLYVAMTRASQRLIIAGYETQNRPAADCWHNLVSQGLTKSMTTVAAPWGGGETILRLGDRLVSYEGGETPQASATEPLPDWLTTAANAEAPAARLRPSGPARQADDARRPRAGQLAHALLQKLPEIEPARRRATGGAWLAAQGADLEAPERATLLEKVLRTMEAPELQPLFGRGSRGEVPFAGVLRRAGRPALSYAGRLDRMLVTESEAWIVDFKLGAPPAKPSPDHVAQLAIYRAALSGALLGPVWGKPVRAALVYLDGPLDRPLVRPIVDAELDAALEGIEAIGLDPAGNTADRA